MAAILPEGADTNTTLYDPEPDTRQTALPRVACPFTLMLQTCNAAASTPFFCAGQV